MRPGIIERGEYHFQMIICGVHFPADHNYQIMLMIIGCCVGRHRGVWYYFQMIICGVYFPADHKYSIMLMRIGCCVVLLKQLQTWISQLTSSQILYTTAMKYKHLLLKTFKTFTTHLITCIKVAN